MRSGVLGVGIAALSATIIAPPVPRLVWNASASAPLGLYVVDPGDEPRMGDMVVARLPAAMRAFASTRHYLPVGVPLVKRVGAVAGDRICATGTAISRDDRWIAVRKTRDGQGRLLPVWHGCRTLRGREAFLLMDAADSFDGRYFGVTDGTDILGTARLVWAR